MYSCGVPSGDLQQEAALCGGRVQGAAQEDVEHGWPHLGGDTTPPGRWRHRQLSKHTEPLHSVLLLYAVTLSHQKTVTVHRLSSQGQQHPSRRQASRPPRVQLRLQLLWALCCCPHPPRASPLWDGGPPPPQDAQILPGTGTLGHQGTEVVARTWTVWVPP